MRERNFEIVIGIIFGGFGVFMLQLLWSAARRAFQNQQGVDEELPEITTALKAHLQDCTSHREEVTEVLHRLDKRLAEVATSLDYVRTEVERLRLWKSEINKWMLRNNQSGGASGSG